MMMSIFKVAFKFVSYVLLGYIIFLVIAFTIDRITGWGENIPHVGDISGHAGYLALFLTITILIMIRQRAKLVRNIKNLIGS